jgi:cardiolipin synthase (CMP-forming)
MDAGFLTLPNSVSLSRLVLAAAFIAVHNPVTRLALIAAAGLTDFLDGWLARKVNSVSRSGALIDPMADRFFVLAAVASYLGEGILTTGQFFVFISRDIATAVGFLVAKSVPRLRPVTFKARWLGKIVTVLQLVTLAAVLLWPEYTSRLIIAIGVVSAASIVDYTRALWRARVR